MIDDHRHDGNHKNGIIDLTDMGIDIRPLQAQWIDCNIDEQKNIALRTQQKKLHFALPDFTILDSQNFWL